MSLELEKLLCPIAGDDPAGIEVEYDPLYAQLESFALGKPPVVMGDSVIEAVPPDWRTLKSSCLTLWEKSRDLRVAIYLCIAEFSLEGMTGFSEALSLVEYLVTEMWPGFYPKLDPEDDNDPTERINIFSMISPPPGSFSDQLMFINKFRSGRLVDDKKYTLRDLLIVNGDLDGGEEKIDPLLFQGEMRSVPIAAMQEKKDLVDKVIDQLRNVCDAVNAQIGDGGISFTALAAELKNLQKFYSSFLLMQPETEAAEENGGEAGDSPAAEATPSRRAAAVDLATLLPANRSEALLLLKKGAEYFQNAEPTSPVPLLVSRAIRMANMSFLDLLGDVEPNALDKGREIFGVKPENE